MRNDEVDSVAQVALVSLHFAAGVYFPALAQGGVVPCPGLALDLETLQDH